MSGRKGTDKLGTRGGTAWSNGLYSNNGTGSDAGSLTETQSVSAGPGGTQQGTDGTVPSSPWFAPIISDSTECKDGVCPVPWATKEAAPVLQEDLVNHPSHYADGAIECIDAIEAQLTSEEFQGYLRGNCVKYTWRWRNKGGLQDLKKAQWYLDRLITVNETQNG
jgi:hypothetical protein